MNEFIRLMYMTIPEFFDKLLSIFSSSEISEKQLFIHLDQSNVVPSTHFGQILF